MICLVLGASVVPAANVAAITPAECDARANDTPAKLVECIQQDDLWREMEDLQAIADANPGPDGHPSRNSGEPGYKASADYVAAKMAAAGYNVTLQPYTFDYFAYTSIPFLRENSPTAHTYTLLDEWGPGAGLGTTTANLAPAGGIVLPPTPTSSSTSGCTPADFTPAMTGHIALIQRGGCNFGVKVLNAIAAGATGVIIFNEGNPGRTDLLIGGMVDANNIPFTATVPVAFTTFAVGNALVAEATAGAVSMSIQVEGIHDANRLDWNVIAESKGGDKNHVLVVDAHLDAIYGAGMLDNASGSVTILDIAEKLKNVTPRNKLRFIWFGGEELGLLGSAYYVNHLTSSERNHIGYDLDADVTATPNYTIGVLDPAGPNLFGGDRPTFPNRVYKPSGVSRDQAISFFDALNLNHELFSPTGTDAFSFNAVGIPAGGLLTGQDCCKTQEEVNLFGGTVGNFEGKLGTFDGGCVDNPFRWCDNLDNNDPTVLTFMSKAMGDMVVRMAFDTKIMSSSNSYVSTKLPTSMGTREHPAR